MEGLGHLYNPTNPQFSIDFILSKARGSLLASGALNPHAFNTAMTAQLSLAAAAQKQINQRNAAALQITQRANLLRNFQLENPLKPSNGKPNIILT